MNHPNNVQKAQPGLGRTSSHRNVKVSQKPISVTSINLKSRMRQASQKRLDKSANSSIALEKTQTNDSKANEKYFGDSGPGLVTNSVQSTAQVYQDGIASQFYISQADSKQQEQ